MRGSGLNQGIVNPNLRQVDKFAPGERPPYYSTGGETREATMSQPMGALPV